MKLDVEATLIPATALAHAEFQNMRLPHLQPYVGEFVNLDVRSGTRRRALDGPIITSSPGDR